MAAYSPHIRKIIKGGEYRGGYPKITLRACARVVSGGVVRRRNGKRGKGMATKKEKTKEQRIKTEKTRLKGIFKDLDENKRKLVTPLIEKAAFMSVELDDLQAKLEKDGWTSEYQNGQNQWGTKKSPEAETYIALSKNYAAVIKQLTELVPAAKRKTSRLAALREE